MSSRDIFHVFGLKLSREISLVRARSEAGSAHIGHAHAQLAFDSHTNRYSPSILSVYALPCPTFSHNRCINHPGHKAAGASVIVLDYVYVGAHVIIIYNNYEKCVIAACV